MCAGNSPAILCARFLKANNYDATLEIFLAEAGLPPNAGSVQPGDMTLEKVLEEKKVFDLSLAFERSNLSGGDQEWSVPAPSKPSAVSALPAIANVLHLSVERVEQGPDNASRQMVFASTADRQLNILDPGEQCRLVQSLKDVHDSPILSCTMLSPRNMIIVTTSMSGQVVLYSVAMLKVLDERRDHKKYVVKVTHIRYNGLLWVATAGWDAKIYIYRFQEDAQDKNWSLGEPVAFLSLATNPETITFLTLPESDQLLFLITRRDSTSLHYYHFDDIRDSEVPGVALRYSGSQSLAPRSNAWTNFSPSSVTRCPSDPYLLAVATSTVPHMKLIIVRMLIPPLRYLETAFHNGAPTQATQSRDGLVIQDQEDAAIKIHVSTFAPQTPYSTPQVCWRPDGSGLWVNGDDGVLRGLDATTGRICSTLQGGHDPGSKIRTIWAGLIDVNGKEEEWVISGGFDKKIVVWKPDAAGAHQA